MSLDCSKRAVVTAVGQDDDRPPPSKKSNRPSKASSTLEGNLGFDRKDVERIVEEAHIVDRAFAKFRHMQTEYGMNAAAFSGAKADLRRRLDKLRQELDRYLALT